MKKNNKGITLIALVVTIIVLLILAGVSIVVLTGQNGILNRTAEAKTTTKIAEIEEQANLIYTNELIGKLSSTKIGNKNVELAEVCNELKKKEKYGYDIELKTTGTPQVDSVVINESELSIMQGGTGTVTATVVPTEATGSWYAVVEGKYYKIDIPTGQKRIKISREETTNATGGGNLPTATFTSNNANVTVSGGTITVGANATGTATITASAGGVAATNECTVTVLSEIGSISVAPTAKSIGTGETAQIGTASPADIIVTANASVASTVAEPVTYSYSSGNTEIATVGETTGIVTGVAVGGPVTVTITATGTISHTAKSATVAVTVTQLVGKFQTVNGKAYYYTGSTPTSGTEITAANMGQFLGMKVDYTPYSKFTDRGTSSTYRLFYIDVNNKYGDGAGTIYLKADNDGNIKSLDSIYITNKTDVNVMDTFNPLWAANSTYAASTYDNAKYSKYLLDKGIWAIYTDTGNLETTQIVKYAVGAPSLEMWVDSYNAFLSKNQPTSGTHYVYNYTVTQDTTNGPTGGNWAYGYYIGYNGEYTNNSGYSTDSNTIVFPSSYSTNEVAADRVKAWTTGPYFWFASPGALASGWVMRYGYGQIEGAGYNSSAAFCPLVCCNSGVAISEAE